MWWFLIVAAVLALVCVALCFALAVPPDRDESDW